MKCPITDLGLQEACTPEGGGRAKLFVRNREEPNFPSLDQFGEACPALPRIRNIQKTIDLGYRDFTRSWGDEIEAFFNPFLDFLIGTENLPVATPWWLTLILIAGAVYLMTDLGMRLVDEDVLEASDAFGANSWQKLFDVQIPLALPNILAGINQTIVMALAMVVIASMVSVRGLGIEVLEAVTNQYLAKGLFNGLV